MLLPEPEPAAAGSREQPEEKGPSRIDESATGGEIDLLERGLDPRDLAWMQLGPHWVTSIFNGGNVWLVQVDGMGPTQRQSLGLSAPVQVVQEQRGRGRQHHGDDDGGVDAGGNMQDR